jgi:acetoacetyl-CoA reductase
MNAIYQKNQRRVLVTGGTRGIGKQIAITFKENGYGVAVGFASNVEAAAKFEEEHGIKTFRWDAGDFQQCQTVLPQICEALGGDIEVLVNNAGITRDKMLHKQEKDNWDKVISNNLTSVFNMSRLVIEGMRESQYGRIINISSVNAHGAPGQTNYAASKAGIEGFTKSLALESAKLGITVNAIAPGYVDTEMVSAVPAEILHAIISKVPANRLGKADEIAQTALFLASNGASFITGAVIPVNGGLHM